MHTLGSTLYHFHANCRSLHCRVRGNARQRAFAATLRRRGAQRPQTLSIMPFSTLPQRLPLQERTVRDVAFQAARELFTIVATSLSTVFQCCRRAMPSSCDARGNPRASHGDGSTRTRLQVTERHQLPSVAHEGRNSFVAIEGLEEGAALQLWALALSHWPGGTSGNVATLGA